MQVVSALPRALPMVIQFVFSGQVNLGGHFPTFTSLSTFGGKLMIKTAPVLDYQDLLNDSKPHLKICSIAGNCSGFHRNWSDEIVNRFCYFQGKM